MAAVMQLSRLSLYREDDPRLIDVTRAVLGDRVLGAYQVIKKYKPDIICLGYDQDALGEDLEEKMESGAIPAISFYRISAMSRG